MKALLLIKESNFQIYCANRLFEANVIDNVIIEDGQSFPSSRLRLRSLIIAPFKIIRQYLRSKNDGLRTINYYLNYRRMFGFREAHNKNILKNKYQKFDEGLILHRFKNADSYPSIELIKKINPNMIFVFGTGLLSESFINTFKIPLINMHWGWSPTYRGDGIFSALAFEGSKGLGVTVHNLSKEVDAGEIIFRKRIEISYNENIYSIGLRCTKLGTDAFIDEFEKYSNNCIITSFEQNLDEGRNYSSKYLKENTMIIDQGWKNLNREKKFLFKNHNHQLNNS